jgi:hypothetical protein
MRERRFGIPVFFAIASIIGFYGWTALSPHSGVKTNGVWSENFYNRAPTGYEELADAFSHGRLSMTEQPKPELLALPDPYDAVANAELRHHDWILYDGKYFLFWSPLPAILLFLPAQVVGLPMNAALACILLGATLLLLTLRVFQQTITSSVRLSPIQTTAISLLVGFGSYTPILLRRPAAYEIPILMGASFAMLALLLFLKTTTRLNPIWISAAMFFAMLSFWSRQSFVLAPLALFGFVLYNNRDRLRVAIYAATPPILLVGGCMAAYNYLRFNSVFEFGTKYQLAGFNFGRFNLGWIVPKLNSDLFTYGFINSFPWITTGDPRWRASMWPLYGLEPNLGLLISMPWLPLFGITLWQRRAEFFRSALILRQSVVLALTIAFGTIIVQTISAPGTTWRYLGDYAPFITFAFLSVQFLIDKKRFKITLTPPLSATLILGSLLIFGINSIEFLLAILVFVAANASTLVVNLNLTSVLVLCSIWTVAIIGLTSLTVGGFDPLNLVPRGYYWWEQ